VSLRRPSIDACRRLLASACLVTLPLAAGSCGTRAVSRWQRTPIGWALTEAGTDGRSLEVAVGFGGCQSSPRAKAIETTRAIIVGVTIKAPRPSVQADCLSMAQLDVMRVPLREPIHGRPISGAREARPGRAVYGPLVPRLTGLSPGEALDIAKRLGYKTRLVAPDRAASASEVIRQTPAAGTPLLKPHAPDAPLVLRSRTMVLVASGPPTGS
jgi:hypothetical protein